MREPAGRKSANWIASYPQVLQAFALPCLVSSFVTCPYWRPGVSSPQYLTLLPHSCLNTWALRTLTILWPFLLQANSMGPSISCSIPRRLWVLVQHSIPTTMWCGPLAPFSIPCYWQLSLVMTMRHRRPHCSGQCFHYELGNAGQELIASAMPPSQSLGSQITPT